MKERILIAEDDVDIVEILDLYLSSEGYEVKATYDGVEALAEINNNEFDLCIIDIMMPKMDGYNLIREIRKTHTMPIIIVSAKNEDNDKILGLNIGADDYIEKPFNPMEVIARVNANIRRSKLEELSEKTIQIKNIKIETDTYTVYKNDKRIELTATEYKILACMMTSPNRVYSRAQISENILGKYCESDEHTITVHISNLRDKLGLDDNELPYIKTVKGLGYKFES